MRPPARDLAPHPAVVGPQVHGAGAGTVTHRVGGQLVDHQFQVVALRLGAGRAGRPPPTTKRRRPARLSTSNGSDGGVRRRAAGAAGCSGPRRRRGRSRRWSTRGRRRSAPGGSPGRRRSAVSSRAVASYGHRMSTSRPANARLISASCCTQAGYSIAVRPAQIGSPMIRTRAGMRVGERPQHPGDDPAGVAPDPGHVEEAAPGRRRHRGRRRGSPGSPAVRRPRPARRRRARRARTGPCRRGSRRRPRRTGPDAGTLGSPSSLGYGWCLSDARHHSAPLGGDHGKSRNPCRVACRRV